MFGFENLFGKPAQPEVNKQERLPVDSLREVLAALSPEDWAPVQMVFDQSNKFLENNKDKN